MAVNTWSDIKTAFETNVGYANNVFFSDAAQVRMANRALDELGQSTRYLEASGQCNAVSGTATYAAEEGYRINRIEYDDVVLFPITRDDMRHMDRDWATRTGLPKYFYLDEQSNAAAADWPYFSVWYTPSANLTNGFRYYYDAVPTAVSNSSPSAEMEIPEWACGAVLFYMLSEAYEAETNLQNFETAAMYRMMYRDIRDRLEARSNDRLPKKWKAGAPHSPTLRVLNRLPDRVPEP
jgi:hypothetical protein